MAVKGFLQTIQLFTFLQIPKSSSFLPSFLPSFFLSWLFCYDLRISASVIGTEIKKAKLPPDHQTAIRIRSCPKLFFLSARFKWSTPTSEIERHTPFYVVTTLKVFCRRTPSSCMQTFDLPKRTCLPSVTMGAFQSHSVFLLPAELCFLKYHEWQWSVNFTQSQHTGRMQRKRKCTSSPW